MDLQKPKGMRDFPPEEMMLRDQIFDTIKNVFELYGYSPLETPLLERMDVLTAKFAAGEGSDARKEIFSLKDQGERDLGLRFDLTVPLARFVSNNPTLKMPFKRYHIGRVYRDGPIKLGRYREFWQCDVDTVGCVSMVADAECINIAFDVFTALGLEVDLQINNRKILTGILDYLTIEKEKQEEVIIAVDKLDKIGEEGVRKELKNLIDKQLCAKLLKILTIQGSNESILKQLKNTIGENQGIKEVEEILTYIDNPCLTLNVALARGLSYYTGTVFEGYLKNKEIASSICGGGRYDELISKYLLSDRQYPSVGISFGIEPITEYFKLKNQEMPKTVAQLYLIPIKTTKQCFGIAKEIRDLGIRVSMDLTGKGISKNLEYASALEIPYSLIVGENEIQRGRYKLKNMVTGKEEEVDLGDIPNHLRW